MPDDKPTDEDVADIQALAAVVNINNDPDVSEDVKNLVNNLMPGSNDLNP